MKAIVTAALALTGLATAATAQEVTLRVHHFMSEKATLHAQFLEPWAEAVETASDGRIEVELYAAMALGGGAPDLYDQAADGAVDIILTLPGYTAGRFPRTEVFELPFFVSDSVAASGAFWDLVETELQDGEYEDTKVLAAWLHGPGVLHTVDPVERLEDIQGRDLRGPTRLVTDLLGELGANPVGMPLPAIPENLSKGVIDGAMLPWEVTPSIRLAELVSNHAEFGGEEAIYTAAFILAMNWDSYEALPDDLRAILDAETGRALSVRAGQVMLDADAAGRAVAEAAGNAFTLLDAEEVARWKEAARPVTDRWIAESAERGFDGAALIETVRGLMASDG